MKLLVNLILGHKASLLETLTSIGHSHEFEIYVDSDGSIGEFVDRVSFQLHESYDNPKRTVVTPPFRLRETAYAGFIVEIKIFFKNPDETEAKSAKFSYDMFLQSNGDAINPIRREKLIFNFPGEDFTKRLLKGGAIVLGNSLNDSSQLTDPMSSQDNLELNVARSVAKKRKFESDEEDVGDQFDAFGILVAHKLRFISSMDKLKGVKTESKLQKLLSEAEVEVLERPRR